MYLPSILSCPLAFAYANAQRARQIQYEDKYKRLQKYLGRLNDPNYDFRSVFHAIWKTNILPNEELQKIYDQHNAGNN